MSEYLYTIIISNHLTIIFFPYTTLFRSQTNIRIPCEKIYPLSPVRTPTSTISAIINGIINSKATSTITRSEEHTSELQSRFDLVCRLLLEKKHIFIFYLYYLIFL